jgi:hypothetical protein
VPFVSVEASYQGVVFWPHEHIEDVFATLSARDRFVGKCKIGVESFNPFISSGLRKIDIYRDGTEGRGVGLFRGDDGRKELVFYSSKEQVLLESCAKLGGVCSEEFAKVTSCLGIVITIFVPEEVEVVGALVFVCRGS